MNIMGFIDRNIKTVLNRLKTVNQSMFYFMSVHSKVILRLFCLSVSISVSLSVCLSLSVCASLCLSVSLPISLTLALLKRKKKGKKERKNNNHPFTSSPSHPPSYPSNLPTLPPTPPTLPPSLIATQISRREQFGDFGPQNLYKQTEVHQCTAPVYSQASCMQSQRDWKQLN